MDTIKLAGVVDLRATKPMRATIHAYSGGIMTPPGWGDVAIDLDGMAIPTTISILDAHENRNSAVIATGRARIDRGELTVDATFLSTAAGIEAAELIRAGTPLQASIGVRTLKTRTLEPGEDVQINGRLIEAGPAGLTLVTESKLQEVSLLPLGADDTTGVSIAARLAADRKDSEKMEFHEWLKAKKFDPANLEDEARDTLLKAYSAEAKGSDIHCEAGGVTLEDRQDARDTMTANLLRANPRQTTAIEHIKALADDEDWSPARLNLECYREMRSGPVIDNRPRAGSGAVMPEILQCAFVMHARGR
ncbi:MAG: hypothetical protein IID33_16320, partial [Planctomycetes bacterium]|nr:hypothetical protein [Planctomycetota bacterium]